MHQFIKPGSALHLEINKFSERPKEALTCMHGATSYAISNQAPPTDTDDSLEFGRGGI